MVDYLSRLDSREPVVGVEDALPDAALFAVSNADRDRRTSRSYSFSLDVVQQNAMFCVNKYHAVAPVLHDHRARK